MTDQEKLETLAQLCKEGKIDELDNYIKSIVESDSIQFFEKYAEQEVPEALFALGYCYSEGIGVDKDEEFANEYLCRVAEHKLLIAQLYYLISIFDDENSFDFTFALTIIKSLLKYDTTEYLEFSHNLLNGLIKEEEDVEMKDILNLFHNSEANAIIICALLGLMMIIQREDCPSDTLISAARLILQIYDENIYTKEFHCLSALYRKYCLEDKYYKAFFKCLEDREIAIFFLSVFLGTKCDSKWDDTYIQLLTECSNRNCSFAQFSLAILYSENNITKDSEHKSIVLFKNALRNGVVYANKRLGYIYLFRGLRNSKASDINTGREFFEQFLSQVDDNYISQHVSAIYYFGLGVQKNFTKAIDTWPALESFLKADGERLRWLKETYLWMFLTKGYPISLTFNNSFIDELINPAFSKLKNILLSLSFSNYYEIYRNREYKFREKIPVSWFWETLSSFDGDAEEIIKCAPDSIWEELMVAWRNKDKGEFCKLYKSRGKYELIMVFYSYYCMKENWGSHRDVRIKSLTEEPGIPLGDLESRHFYDRFCAKPLKYINDNCDLTKSVVSYRIIFAVQFAACLNFIDFENTDNFVFNLQERSELRKILNNPKWKEQVEYLTKLIKEEFVDDEEGDDGTFTNSDFSTSLTYDNVPNHLNWFEKIPDSKVKGKSDEAIKNAMYYSLSNLYDKLVSEEYSLLDQDTPKELFVYRFSGLLPSGSNSSLIFNQIMKWNGKKAILGNLIRALYEKGDLNDSPKYRKIQAFFGMDEKTNLAEAKNRTHRTNSVKTTLKILEGCGFIKVDVFKKR